MRESITLEGYGSNSTLADNNLHIVAAGVMGRGALGASERVILLDEISAIEFHRATALVNGSLLIESTVGKTILHFRRKRGEQAKVLYDALLAGSAASLDAKVTAGLANERRDATAVRAAERIARAGTRSTGREAQLDADLRRVSDDYGLLEVNRADGVVRR